MPDDKAKPAAPNLPKTPLDGLSDDEVTAGCGLWLQDLLDSLDDLAQSRIKKGVGRKLGDKVQAVSVGLVDLRGLRVLQRVGCDKPIKLANAPVAYAYAALGAARIFAHAQKLLLQYGGQDAVEAFSEALDVDVAYAHQLCDEHDAQLLAAAKRAPSNKTLH